MSGQSIRSAAITVAFLIAGCNSQTNPQQGLSPSDPKAVVQPGEPPRPAVRKPDSMDASADSADVLARKAAAYSREMESLLARRSNATTPSEVRWADPHEFRLSDLPAPIGDASEPSKAREIQPVIQSSPSSANQSASLASASSNLEMAANVPARGVDPATRPSSSKSSANTDHLLEKFSRRVKENPRDVSSHLEYQLLQFLFDEQVPQLAMLAVLPSEDREMLTAVLDALTLFRNTLRSDNNMLLSKKIRPLLEMSDRLKSQAELSIPTIALCRSVDGFGKYDPIESARFAAGADHRAVIYCEIANFASILNEQHLWETQLKQDMVLYTEGGMAVWNDKTETISDAARVRRQDFFVNKRIVIPANLTIGRYLLKVTIVDLQASRVAEATIPIIIAAK